MPGPNPSATITYTYTVDPRIRCDKDYMKSLEGIMKLVTQLLALGCIISASVVDFKNSREGEFYISVASSLLSYTGIMSAMYNFHVCEKFHKLPWLKIEVILMSIFLVCLIIASVLAVTEPKKLSVASVFGFATDLVLLFEIFRKTRIIKSGGIAQGTRQIVRQPGQSQC